MLQPYVGTSATASACSHAPAEKKRPCRRGYHLDAWMFASLGLLHQILYCIINGLYCVFLLMEIRCRCRFRLAKFFCRRLQLAVLFLFLTAGSARIMWYCRCLSSAHYSGAVDHRLLLFVLSFVFVFCLALVQGISRHLSFGWYSYL